VQCIGADLTLAIAIRIGYAAALPELQPEQVRDATGAPERKADQRRQCLFDFSLHAISAGALVCNKAVQAISGHPMDRRAV
jgi:hypothetical protein